MNIRLHTEELEYTLLSKLACHSRDTKGRQTPEEPDEIRTCFQRDRDRIIHCKSFRRLMHKTQVFLAPKGDHYRTRLTHVLEVSQIARTISRALRLNEDLTEAIALGHDLGHTPFGHAGEAVLRELHPRGFDHFKQSLRVVELIENNGKGLNLTLEVRDGILKHSKGKGRIIPDEKTKAITLEGQVVRLSDIIAYLNHDLDDAIRAEVIKANDIPKEISSVIGTRYSQRIDTMVTDLIYTSAKNNLLIISMSEQMLKTVNNLRDFLFSRVYESETIMVQLNKAKKIFKELYQYYYQNIDQVHTNHAELDKDTMICDMIAGMTDRFALDRYQEIFLPKRWPVF
ncbi:MAG: deoxyguanosinetriphosphate triphosphohydrolase [Nitrospirae bacterium]|nr:deoxyguanosinetriphosphate triphosphohydrolase [Nitrospirota bacterium]